jgi:hypothetical protein
MLMPAPKDRRLEAVSLCVAADSDCRTNRCGLSDVSLPTQRARKLLPPAGTLGVVPDRSRKRPRDPNQLAKLIVDIATGETKDPDPDEGKDPAAVALGRKGGLKGGKARAASMTPEERSNAARRAAQARWSGGEK